MSFRNISAWSIRNPVPPIVLFIALTVAGLFAFNQMQVQNDPDVEFPVVSVNISLPAAAPSELENQITRRVETAIRNVQGVDEINSSVSEGNSSTWVQLAIGTPVDQAVDDIRDAMSQIRSDLPDGILEPQISRVNASQGDLASWAVISTAMGLEELSWYVDNSLTRELLAVPGMAAVSRAGGVDREIRVDLDPLKMQALGITAGQVNQILRQVNLDAGGGRAEIAEREQSVRVLGNAKTAYELGQTQISLSGGRTVRLDAVANVTDGYREQRGYATRDGQQVLAVTIQRSKGESDVTVFRGAEAVLADIAKRNPEVKFEKLTDNARFANEQYTSSMLALIEGAILAVIVVFIFLRDWRATFISALAIPLSAIPAFFFMDLMGFTLNGLTLLALALVAGVLVDDAIVEIENIVRHMRMGKSAYQASIDAADEIGLPVLATSMVIVAVFLPVGLMPGVSGQFFKNFGFTIVIAVLISLAVARMITPMMAAYLLKAHGTADHAQGRIMDKYIDFLKLTLNHRRWVMVGAAAALGLTGWTFTALPMTFQPAFDQDSSSISIELAPGSTLEQVGAVAREVEALVKREPEVESVFARVSLSRIGANLNVKLVPRKDRSRTSLEFEREVGPKLTQIADARVSFRSQFGGFTGRELNLTLGGDDPQLLNATAAKLVGEMEGLKELRGPRVSGDLRRPEIIIKPRMDLASELGISTAALSQAIRVATIGEIDQNSARFSLSDRQIPIRVKMEENARAKLASIENLQVPTSNGGSVPLRLVADISYGSGPTRIERTNLARRVTIGADLGPGVVTSDAWKVINALPTMKNLPQGVSRVQLGMEKWQTELLFNFVIALIAGLSMVFGVLVLLYHRLMPPLINMASLSLAPLGGTLALMAFGMPLSMPVFIGILMLIGIVGKNSILLVDFALEEMAKGVSKYDAIVDAGRKRAQPIVMTTVAMAAGMVPTALALSGDGAWRQPMGVVVIGGLLLSTVLTLVIVPAAFSLAVGAEQRAGPWLRRKLLTYQDGDDAGDRAGQPGAQAAPQPAE